MEYIFENAGKPWTPEEDIQLNKLYNEDRMDIIEISKIHKRAPGGIISRLSNHNYIVNRESARGYLEYKNSDLYKQIVAQNQNKKKTKIDEKPKHILSSSIDNLLITIRQSDYLEIQNDVKEMKNEIKELKKDIKELISMMKAVYEFVDE